MAMFLLKYLEGKMLHIVVSQFNSIQFSFISMTVITTILPIYSHPYRLWKMLTNQSYCKLLPNTIPDVCSSLIWFCMLTLTSMQYNKILESNNCTAGTKMKKKN